MELISKAAASIQVPITRPSGMLDIRLQLACDGFGAIVSKPHNESYHYDLHQKYVPFYVNIVLVLTLFVKYFSRPAFAPLP
jgi:hypothetical protein